MDILSPDISQSMWANGGKICEINSRPGIRKHMWPSVGQQRDVATPILTMLFGPQIASRVPIVAVLGHGNTVGICETIARALERGGHHVGVYLLEHPGKRDFGSATLLTGEHRASSLALDANIEVIVVELDAARVVSSGLEIDAIDVAVLADRTGSDHVPESSDDAADSQTTRSVPSFSDHAAAAANRVTHYA